MNKLAILIPTIVGREHFLERLEAILYPQITEELSPHVEIIIDKDNREVTIGEKRNRLMQAAIDMGCTHRAFVDDDDTLSEHYLRLNMAGVMQDADVNTLIGHYYNNGVYDRPFIHSLQYDHAYQDNEWYYRPPNHLNVTKIELIKDILYEHKSFGEDMTHCMEVVKADRLQREFMINQVVYHYYFRTKPDGI